MTPGEHGGSWEPRPALRCVCGECNCCKYLDGRPVELWRCHCGRRTLTYSDVPAHCQECGKQLEDEEIV